MDKKNIIIVLLALCCTGLLAHISMQKPKIVRISHRPQEITSITGVGVGDNQEQASLNAWENAKRKMEAGGYTDSTLKKAGMDTMKKEGDAYKVSIGFAVIKQ